MGRELLNKEKRNKKSGKMNVSISPLGRIPSKWEYTFVISYVADGLKQLTYRKMEPSCCWQKNRRTNIVTMILLVLLELN
jgi:hypothetical protein